MTTPRDPIEQEAALGKYHKVRRAQKLAKLTMLRKNAKVLLEEDWLDFHAMLDRATDRAGKLFCRNGHVLTIKNTTKVNRGLDASGAPKLELRCMICHSLTQRAYHKRKALSNAVI